MDYNQQLEKIHGIINNHIPLDEEIASLLTNHSCLDILFHIANNTQYIRMPIVANSLIIKIRYHTCQNLFQGLQELQYAVIKGAVLSARMHGNSVVRLSNDIDILISPNDIDMVKNLLLKNGFIQGRAVNGEIIPYTRQELIYQTAFTHQVAAFCKKTNNKLCPIVNIDINTDIFWGESSEKTDMSRFLQNCETFNIYNTDVKRLSPIYEFISLCMHHYKDLNSIYLLWERGIHLTLFSDIYYYIKNVHLNFNELKTACQSFNTTDYVNFCLYHTNTVFEDEKLKTCLSLFESTANTDILNRIGLSEREYKYLPKGISEYLFDESFKPMLETLLTEEDLYKIETNKQFM